MAPLWCVCYVRFVAVCLLKRCKTLLILQDLAMEIENLLHYREFKVQNHDLFIKFDLWSFSIMGFFRCSGTQVSDNELTDGPKGNSGSQPRRWLDFLLESL
ncbi:hypothetical protein AVEN_67323-1 [Araneus ventricosus]|uniref:Uncharacterized protein n=1 Tax=Araneus ventricosus TaxID=182803 RepID=A0A4Y2TKZ5_ARAVE|nr:hypothetical protein AVEN_67323-1 [Araneus ventricosus]